MKRSTLVRGAIFLATVVASWAVLSLGTGAEPLNLVAGNVAEQDYVAGRTATVVDVVATEELRQAARDAVPPPREVDLEIERTVLADIESVFDNLQTMVIGDPLAADVIPELPAAETPTTEPDSSTTTQAPANAVVGGLVYLDLDGDGVFTPDAGGERSDRPLAGVGVEVTAHDGTETLTTGDQGEWSYEMTPGPVVVVVDADGAAVPAGFVLSTANTGQLIECDPGDSCVAGEVGFSANLRDVEDVAAAISATHGLPSENAEYLASVASDDVVRSAIGLPLHLSTIQTAALNEATLRLGLEIEPEELVTVRANVRLRPPVVVHPDTGSDPEGSAAAAEVVFTYLAANYTINDDLWTDQQDAAAAEVLPQEVTYIDGETIVDQGDVLAPLDIAAIEATTPPTLEGQPGGGLLAVMTVLVGLLGVYLATFRPEFWARPRMVALLGIMVVLAAGAVRGTVALHESFTWYILPAVAFGFITAVLFDQRIGVLMALCVGVLTAVGTLDTGVTVYAILAAMAPIPFVSAVSSRGAFRNAILLSSVVAAAVAAATSLFFHVGPNDAVWEVVGISVAWAFGVSVVTSLLGLAGLQFFESAFDITTTLGLLDLTDRNHEALQMLQEKAFGTFNHSLMVGTLADAAARSIGANALLARAMAYYHDLGKTENPTFFIENQFGISNPHDMMEPRDSAEIIRSHVTSGVALARDYKIPTEVTEGIVSHHGDGVMRYFYEKARQQYGEDGVNIDDFRHVGHKPRTAETAILMLADSLEAACRAVFQTEEPSPSAIEKVVDRIMDEKLEDGQLSASPLTLAELTKIRQAFLESLVGHYHQRIAYPNFPGS